MYDDSTERCEGCGELLKRPGTHIEVTDFSSWSGGSGVTAFCDWSCLAGLALVHAINWSYKRGIIDSLAAPADDCEDP